MTDKPWSTRIPAMIAKGAKLTADGDILGGSPDWVCLTTGEVALAKALWHEMRRAMDRMNGTERAAFIAGFRGAVIRAYTEKLEGL